MIRSSESDDVHPPGGRTFTAKQGQYLAFIYYYEKVNGAPPAQRDFQRYFRTTPPTVHQMIFRLEQGGWITRVPGKARSLELRVDRRDLPDLM